MTSVSRDAPRLVLASASPRRQELLRDAGYAFHVIPADIDEGDYPPALSPGELAEYLAVAKARAVLQPTTDEDDTVVLAADTVVALDNQPLGKPTDPDDARRMLSRLGGTTHAVITGVAVAHRAGNLLLTARVTSSVHMRQLSDAEVDAYVASNEWQGKAGGYGIQDDDPFVTRTAGCHTNIVGLPMTTTAELLAKAGVHPRPGIPRTG
jgi:septum formation protein